MKKTSEGKTLIGTIALIAIALMVGIWIQAETEIVKYDVKHTPSFQMPEKSTADDAMMMEAKNEVMEIEAVMESDEVEALEEDAAMEVDLSDLEELEA